MQSYLRKLGSFEPDHLSPCRNGPGCRVEIPPTFVAGRFRRRNVGGDSSKPDGRVIGPPESIAGHGFEPWIYGL